MKFILSKDKKDTIKVVDIEISEGTGSIYLKIDENVVVSVSSDGNIDTDWCAVDGGYKNAGKIK